MSIKLWTSGTGIIAMLLYVAGAVGGFLSGYFFWLPTYQDLIGTEAELVGLIMMILMLAVAAFCIIALIISIFGIPKALWIIFAFLSLACAVVPAILITVALADYFSFTGMFVYFDLSWYNSGPEFIMDFIGFWLAAGGSFLAFLIGFFIPKKN